MTGSDDGGKDDKENKRLVFDIADKLPLISPTTRFTPEIIEEILIDIADGLHEKEAILKRGLVWAEWWRCRVFYSSHALFQRAYKHAQEAWAASMEHAAWKIARDNSNDVLIDAKGGQRSDNTQVNRDRISIDWIKWLMSKKVAHIYGDKQQINVEGSIDVTPIIQISMKSSDKLKRATQASTAIDVSKALDHENKNSSEVGKNNKKKKLKPTTIEVKAESE